MQESEVPHRADAVAARDALLFDVAPVSMWIEDASAVLALFQTWSSQGVTSFHDHIRTNPALRLECSLALRIEQVNAKTLTQYEATDFPHLLACLPQIFGAEAFVDMTQVFDDLWNGHREFSCRTVNYTITGRRLDVQIWGRILPGHEQDWKSVLLVIEDVTELETARHRAASSEAYARRLFDHSPSALLVQDCSQLATKFAALRAEGVVDLALFMTQQPHFVEECIAAVRILDVNHRTLELYGCTDLPELVDNLVRMMGAEGRNHRRRHYIDLWNGELEQRSETINYTLSGELRHLKRAFSIFPGHETDWSLAVVSLDDITESKLATERLRYLSTHDELTGLYNRAFYAQTLGAMRCDTQPLTIVSLDVNGLKRMNDRFGHAAGDALITRAARVLTASVTDACYPIRVGGDEFVVLMPGADATAADRMKLQLDRQLFLDNQEHPGAELSVSIGVATSAANEDVTAVVQRADAEMYVAKRDHYQLSGFERRTSY